MVQNFLLQHRTNPAASALSSSLLPLMSEVRGNECVFLTLCLVSVLCVCSVDCHQVAIGTTVFPITYSCLKSIEVSIVFLIPATQWQRVPDIYNGLPPAFRAWANQPLHQFR